MAAGRRLLFFGMEGVERTIGLDRVNQALHLRRQGKSPVLCQLVEALPRDFGSNLFNLGPCGLMFLGLCPGGALFLSLE